MSEEYIKLYNDLYPLLRAQILQDYATAGIEAYEAASPDYETAASKLEMANKFEDTSNYGQTWAQRQYYLADSYYQLYEAADDKTAVSDNITKAKDVIEQLAEAFPDSEYTVKANALLDKLSELDSDSSSETTGTTSETTTGTPSGTTTGTAAETATGTNAETTVDAQTDGTEGNE